MPPPRRVALVAAGGAVGAVARVALSRWSPVADAAYPWITFAENLTGAFTLALVLTLLAERLATDPGVRLFLCTGALGAFTTYSTLAKEVTGRLLDGNVLLVVAYLAASILGGLAAAIAGARAARARPRVPTWVRHRRRSGRRTR